MATFHRLDKAVGERVLKAHNYMCSTCSKKTDLCVHHIERRKIQDVDYNEENNLTVLCRSCHMKYHRQAGHVIPSNIPGNNYGRRGKGVPPIVCKITDCDKLQHGRSFCHTHYEYFRKRNWIM